MNKKILIPIVVVALTGITIFSAAHRVSAQGNSNEVPDIVQKIAHKFGLNEADVQSVFDEERQRHASEMHAKFEKQLTQNVKDGKLTEAQMQLILAKHKEMQTLHETKKEEFKNMTPEQQKSKMEAKHQELENWAKQNNIDVKYLSGKKGLGKHHKMMMKW